VKTKLLGAGAKLIFIAVASVFASGVNAQNLTEQAQCAAQARTAAQEDNYKWEAEARQMNLGMRTTSFDYQSHYNTKLKRCLVLTTRIYNFGGAIHTNKNLFDAFERRDYAVYTLTSRSPTPLVCQLLPTFGQPVFCKADEEFDAFVAEYMTQ